MSHYLINSLIGRNLFASNKELKFYVISIRFDQLLEIIADGFFVLLVTRVKNDVLSGLDTSLDFFQMSSLFFLLLIGHLDIGSRLLGRIFAFLIFICWLGLLFLHGSVFLSRGLWLVFLLNFETLISFTKTVDSTLELVHALFNLQIVGVHRRIFVLVIITHVSIKVIHHLE